MSVIAVVYFTIFDLDVGFNTIVAFLSLGVGYGCSRSLTVVFPLEDLGVISLLRPWCIVSLTGVMYG
jgi:hypothetical protein